MRFVLICTDRYLLGCFVKLSICIRVAHTAVASQDSKLVSHFFVTDIPRNVSGVYLDENSLDMVVQSLAAAKSAPEAALKLLGLLVIIYSRLRNCSIVY